MEIGSHRVAITIGQKIKILAQFFSHFFCLIFLAISLFFPRLKMNPLCSETYIRLIAQWLPVTPFERIQHKTLRSYTAINLIGFVQVHRLVHIALRNRRISVQWDISVQKVVSLYETRYWIPVAMRLPKYIHFETELAPYKPVLTHLTLMNWFLREDHIRILENVCPLLTHLNLVDTFFDNNGTQSSLALINFSLVRTMFRTQALFRTWPNVVQVHLNGCGAIELYYLAHLPHLETLSLFSLGLCWIIEGENTHTALDWPSLKRVTLNKVALGWGEFLPNVLLFDWFPSGGNWESSPIDSNAKYDHQWTKN